LIREASQSRDLQSTKTRLRNASYLQSRPVSSGPRYCSAHLTQLGTLFSTPDWDTVQHTWLN